MLKTSTLLLAGALLLPATWLAATAQSLDPSFTPGAFYAPARAYSALEQADGKRVLLGNFTRANGTAASHLVRYTAAGAVDAAFQQNLGTTSQIYRATQLASGKLLLTGFADTPLVAGGLTRNGLLRLNADGTADASFNPGTGPGSPSNANAYNGIDYALPLPNGQFLVAGLFDQFNGVASRNLVRLNADGSVDTSFNANLASGDEIEYVALLPSGKYLIGGFSYNSATTFPLLTRLNTDGSADPSFNANLRAYDDANYFVVQPDGKLLVAGSLSPANAPNPTSLVRLLPDGSLDNTFTPPANLANTSIYSGYGQPLELQPDGKILVLNNTSNQSTGLTTGLIRLNADGSLDSSLQLSTGDNGNLNSITRLASGGLLVAGDFTSFAGTLDRPVVQLTSTGATDLTFAPTLQIPATVNTLVQQADGKIIVGGDFSEFNGQPVRRVARLTAAGGLDASFTSPTLNGRVTSLALQPDGRLLLLTPNSVQRLLASGARDNSFAPPSLVRSNLSRLLLQPDGRILLGGSNASVNGTGLTTPLLRLLADGSRDASFAPVSSGAGRFGNVFSLALQPDGRLLVGGTFYPTSNASTISTVARLESTGARDASFATTDFTVPASFSGFTALASQPDGKVLVGGFFTAVAGTLRTGLTRLNADGTPDTGFAAPFTSGTVSTLLVQPNGRILAGGTLRGPGVPNNLARLLPSGAIDPSFGATAVPNSYVLSLLTQPDGNLLLAGGFTSIGGQASSGVARLTATGGLPVRAPQAVADRTTAWPVPAHTTLTVAPDASAHAQALDILDVLGRPVRHLALGSSAAATLTVAGLPAGTYLLRVSYAEGLVTRRIQVQ